ncbi:MAG: phosphocholine cytidylyltransferase family protein [Candidatus Woesearchaeota archaeon]|nr:MAG: phosphocholine cytidylyltransferase family protein [Candidatus Woesearchaeota archaeon]
MKAIILAAGKGTRLKKYTKNLPKCMLKFNGKSLIQRQIETLRACGVTDITIVKGYMADKIKIPDVKYYTNEDYENTNMVETLFSAEEEMIDEILVCYGDIIYEKRVINKILSDRSDIGVTVDTDYLAYWSARLDKPKEDMESLVVDKDGRIVELGNCNCSPDEAKIRYVGLIKFSKYRVEALKKVYHENKEKYFDKDEPWLNSKSFKKAYMTCMLQALINNGYLVKTINIKNSWLEFDTDEDYEKYQSWLENKTLNRFIDLEG